MKKYICSAAILAASILFSVSCVNEKMSSDNNVETPEETPSGKVTITASFPEVIDSKVTMVETSTGLDLKWKDTDFLTVVGNTTETFTIKAGSISEDGKTAVFEGNPVEGTSFKVILSSKGETYLDRDDFTKEPKLDSGTDMAAKLEYDAVLEGVKNYNNVSFSEQWAEENDAIFSETGCLMLHLLLPAECKSVTNCKIAASENVFSVSNRKDYSRVNVRKNKYNTYQNTTGGGELKSYFMTPMNEDMIAAGTILSVILETSNSGTWIKHYVLPEDFYIKPGRRNILKLNSENWENKTLTWAESAELKAGWTVPYVNISATGYTPANLLDGTDNKNFGKEWVYPWGTNRCYIDKNFNDWTYTTEHSLGSDPLMTAKAPMLCIIDLGQKEVIHTMKIVNRGNNKQGNMTTGEIWISVDSTNDDELNHDNIITANKHTEPQDGQWLLWKDKKWTKLLDVEFSSESAGNVSPLAICYTRYIMLVVHEGKKGESGETPDIGLAEFSLRYFK